MLLRLIVWVEFCKSLTIQIEGYPYAWISLEDLWEFIIVSQKVSSQLDFSFMSWVQIVSLSFYSGSLQMSFFKFL